MIATQPRDGIAAPTTDRPSPTVNLDLAHLEAIPQAMRDAPRWVVWALVARGTGKPTKEPRQAAIPSRRASTTDASTWGTFDDAVAAYQADPDTLAGIGFVLGDGWAGIDLDDCIDPVTGRAVGSASDIVRQAATYTERSPSGTGLKLVLRGAFNAKRSRRKLTWGMGHDGELEAYDKARYFTVTATPYMEIDDDEVVTIARQIDEETDALIAQLLDEEGNGAKPPSQPPTARGRHDRTPNFSDDEVVDIARRARNGERFSALHDRGDLSAYDGDASRADLGLIRRLAFFTQDRAQLERIWKGSALWREKLSRSDYIDRTIDTVLDGLVEVYAPRNEGTPQLERELAWADPEPLDSTPHVPAFDPETMLSPACPGLARFVTAVSGSVQTPPDLAATVALPLALSGLAHRYDLEVKPGQAEPAALYVLASMGAGEGKGRTTKLMLDPLEGWCSDEEKRLAPIIAQAKRDRAKLEKRRASLEADYIKSEEELPADNPIRTELTCIDRKLAENPVPVAPLSHLSDITPEALVDVLLDHNGGARVFATEAPTLENMLGKYSGSLGVDTINHAYEAEPITEARRTRKREGEPLVVRIPSALVNLCWFVQPSVTAKLLGTDGAHERGFVSRFLFVAPDSRIGSRTVRDTPILPEEDRKAYDRATRRILNLSRGSAPERPRTITLSAEARELYLDMAEAVERALARGGELEDMRAWGQRQPGRIARIALALHAWRWAYGDADTLPDFIDAETMRTALAWDGYLRAHYRRVAEGQAGADFNPDLTRARKLMGKFVAHAQDSGEVSVTQRQAHKVLESDWGRAVRRGDHRTPVEAVRAALGVAEEMGWLRRLETPSEGSKRGRKASASYELSPSLLT